MFCPQCSQQSSEDVRFCPRCGLPLAGLSAFVAGNDFTALAPDAARAPERAAKRAGVRRGAKLIFLSVVITPALLGLCFLFNSPVPLFVPFTLFLAGLAWLVYALLFGDEILNVGSLAARRNLKAGGGARALDAPQFVPAPLFNAQRVNTSEIVPPPSVTESTTSLLGRDAE